MTNFVIKRIEKERGFFLANQVFWVCEKKEYDLDKNKVCGCGFVRVLVM